FNRGNVTVLLQVSTELRCVLPPSPNDIRDTVYGLFSDGTRKPDENTIRLFKPVLVSKERVETLILFLMDNNE
ncbi:hypothetical protein PAXRUDRAFT_47694, partial [Paxillus rubicundulus Ve08.2h10]